MTSREQRHITKEHIRSNTYKFNFSALYSSTLVIKCFKSNIKLFLIVTLLASLVLLALQPARHAHF